VDGGAGRGGQGQQAGDLGGGQRDHAGVGGRGLAGPERGRRLGVGAVPELGGGDGADGQGGHDQDGVPGDGGVEADLGFIQAEEVLRGRHTLRGFDRLPAEVELTNPRHPLAGRRVPVMSAYRRNGGVWLVVMLPDGFPAPVRVGDTDLGGPGVAATGTTILSVAGIRRLRELAAGVAAKGRDQ
jgi:hypothetical protein